MTAGVLGERRRSKAESKLWKSQHMHIHDTQQMKKKNRKNTEKRNQKKRLDPHFVLTASVL